MLISIRDGEGAFGYSLMKFTLTYDGELRANDDYRRKWEIRKQLHPQLEELWRVNSSLKALLRQHRYVPADSSYLIYEIHHTRDAGLKPVEPSPGSMDLLAPIQRGDRKFSPLVRNSLALKCGIKILFLRKEEPGRVYQGGDLDNRLKTLFDALSVSNSQQVVIGDTSINDPVHCLLEDDALITNCNIETHRLLSRPEGSKHEVHLVIEVDVRVTQSRLYNQFFLGD